jgi:hypothetical protein
MLLKKCMLKNVCFSAGFHRFMERYAEANGLEFAKALPREVCA